MYKPHTIEHYKLLQILNDQFALEQFDISPLSRSSLLVEDRDGGKIAFSYDNGIMRQAEIPSYISPSQARDYIREQNLKGKLPPMFSFSDVTRWWLNTPNPLSYQQALGLSDGLYRHFLRNPLLDDDAALALVSKGKVSDKEYNDLLLWYFDKHRHDCWLGCLGVDGIGELYGLTRNYGTEYPETVLFYLTDD